MSRERRFNVRPKLDCFYFPPQEVEEHVDKKKGNSEYKTQENGNVSVIKMLDALRLASFENKLSNAGRLNNSTRSLRDVEYVSTKNSSMYDDQVNGESVEEVKREYKMLGLSPKRTLDVDTIDSLSDSAYSQSSELSRDSDTHSLNTVSSDSSNLFVYQQIMQTERKDIPAGCSTVTMHTASGFSIDIDVEVTKTVVMLMKIILWLRQKEAKRLLQTPKQLDFSMENQTTHNLSEKSLIPYETKQPKSPRRISFSPCTLLINAVTEKSFHEAKNILESDDDIDVNTKTPSGQSLIHIAAGNADLKCVQLLLEHGANPNIKDEHGWGPLHAAIRRGKWKCAILLIEAGANFAEYSNQRIQEYKEVLRMSRTCYKSMEIFV